MNNIFSLVKIFLLLIKLILCPRYLYFKFELEAVPLRTWPVPVAFSSEVVQVTTFIKVTKECILLGLMAHENDWPKVLKYFETKLMPQVVANVAAMSSDIALAGLRDLKEKCPFTKGGFRVSKECWKLQDTLDYFYRRHQW